MILGIDGCSSGWVCALGAIENTQLKVIELRFAYHPDEIWTPAIKKICIDMPIGLPNISKKCEYYFRKNLNILSKKPSFLMIFGTI